MKKTIVDYALQLKAAVRRASEEHGTPNSFSFGELYAIYNGPSPMIAGRAAKTMSDMVVCKGRVVVN